MNITEKFGLLTRSKSVKSLKKLTEKNKNLIDTMSNHNSNECTEQEKLEIDVFLMIGLILSDKVIEECQLVDIDRTRIFEVFCRVAMGELE